jgi:hypothetical protein
VRIIDTIFGNARQLVGLYYADCPDAAFRATVNEFANVTTAGACLVSDQHAKLMRIDGKLHTDGIWMLLVSRLATLVMHQLQLSRHKIAESQTLLGVEQCTVIRETVTWIIIMLAHHLCLDAVKLVYGHHVASRAHLRHPL